MLTKQEKDLIIEIRNAIEYHKYSPQIVLDLQGTYGKRLDEISNHARERIFSMVDNFFVRAPAYGFAEDQEEIEYNQEIHKVDVMIKRVEVLRDAPPIVHLVTETIIKRS